MDLLLSKILNYESEIFDKYLEQRLKMRTFVEKIKINNLDNTQLLLFIDNLKSIIDPLKTTTMYTQQFLNNPYQNNENKTQNEFILFYFLFGSRFFEGRESSELIEDVSTLSESSESLVLSEPE